MSNQKSILVNKILINSKFILLVSNSNFIHYYQFKFEDKYIL
jgi:hypothetical protein